MDNNSLRNSPPRNATVGSIEVQLLGRFGARSAGQPLKDLHSGKAQELLSYLILHRDRPHLRESLAGILWEDDTSASPRKTLRQTLWQLQSALSSAAPPLRKIGRAAGPDWIGLSPQVEMHVDVEAWRAPSGESRRFRATAWQRRRHGRQEKRSSFTGETSSKG